MADHLQEKLFELITQPRVNDSEISRLLNTDVSCDVQSSQGQTPLMVFLVASHSKDAAHVTDSPNISTILAKTTKFTLADRSGLTLLHYYAMYGVERDLDKVLASSELGQRDRKKLLPLHHMATLKVARTILEYYQLPNKLPNWHSLAGFTEDNPPPSSPLLTNLKDLFSDPNRFGSRFAVVTYLAAHAAAPHDTGDVLLETVKAAKNHPDLAKRVLEEVVKPINGGSVTRESLEEAMKTESVLDMLIQFADIESFEKLLQTEVILTSVKKRSGDSFWQLKTILRDENFPNTARSVRDKFGRNLAHYICENTNTDVLEYLRKQPELYRELFTSADDSEKLPLAALRSDKSEFLENFDFTKDKFLSEGKPGLDLLHYYLEQGSADLADKLLEMGYPMINDAKGRSVLMKITSGVSNLGKLLTGAEHRVIPTLERTDGLLKSVLLASVAGFRALDFTVLYEDVEQFELLRGKCAICGQDTEKMIHYLIEEKKRKESDIAVFCRELSVTYPSVVNKEHHRAISEALTDYEAPAIHHPLQPRPGQQATTAAPFHIFLLHDAPPPVVTPRNEHTHVQLLPLAGISWEDGEELRGLPNRRLIVAPGCKGVQIVQDLLKIPRGDAAAKDNIRYTDHISAISASNKVDIPEVLMKTNRDDNDGNGGSLPKTVASQLNEFSRVYHTSPDPSTGGNGMAVATLRPLPLVRLRDVEYYTAKGCKKTWSPSQFKCDASHDMIQVIKVMENSILKAEEADVTLHFLPIISRLLVERGMLIPGDDGYTLLLRASTSQENPPEDPEVRIWWVRGEDHCAAAFSKSAKPADRQYFLQLLAMVGLQLQKGHSARLEFGLKENSEKSTYEYYSLSSGAVPTYEGLRKEEKTVHQENIPLLPSLAQGDGDTLLRQLNIEKLVEGIYRINNLKPLLKLYESIKESTMCKEVTPEKLIYRLCVTRPDLNLRGFFTEGGFSDSERQTICSGLSVDPSHTYTRCANFWRLNGFDLALFFGGIAVVIIIIVACDEAGVDLDGEGKKYGVAGLASLPFFIAICTRVFKTCSHHPQTSDLPDLADAISD